MKASIYELRRTNHAEELIHYLTNLVIPKAIDRQPHSKFKAQPQDRNESAFSMDAFATITNEDVAQSRLVRFFR
ncbi:MAG: hypothetical protein ABI761_13410 [Saprospiraceae bacterium]